jgi:hypothetical protein
LVLPDPHSKPCPRPEEEALPLLLLGVVNEGGQKAACSLSGKSEYHPLFYCGHHCIIAFLAVSKARVCRQENAGRADQDMVEVCFLGRCRRGREWHEGVMERRVVAGSVGGEGVVDDAGDGFGDAVFNVYRLLP